MRKLASVVKISKVSPIEGADRLEVAEMDGKGWRVVTAKGEFKAGDPAVYFEIDSALPFDDERYAFLRERCARKFVTKSGELLHTAIRIKTMKLRGVVSQGLLIPLSQFPEIAPSEVEGRLMFHNLRRSDSGTETDKIAYENVLEPLFGADVSALLKVEHIDDVAARYAPVQGGSPTKFDAYGPFPSSFIPKTDEERVQNLADWFDRYRDMEFEVTAKDDGSSVTMFYSPTVDEENPFGVCSRNMRLKEVMSDGTTPLAWEVAKKYDVQSKLKALFEKTGMELAFQGELLGPGVNRNRDLYQEHEWHVFKIWDVKKQEFLLPQARRDLCKEVGLEHVALLAERVRVFGDCRVEVDGEFAAAKSIDAVLKMAEGKTRRGNEREGIVFKSVEDPSVSFKAVSNRYLLKQKD